MANTTAKSHKSRKTGDEPKKPRQRTQTEDVLSLVRGSSPVESPSSLIPATTPLVPPNSLEEAQALVEAKVDTGIPVEKPKEQQPWYRAPDSKQRPKVEKIALAHAAGHTLAEIAKRMKTTEGYIKQLLFIGRKNGWLDADDEPIDVEVELATTIDKKVVRNISASLDGQMTNWQTHEMTLAAAKGRGMFKSHDKVEGGPPTLQVVAIRIDMPPVGSGDQHVLDEANIGGTPAYLDGEVSEVIDGPLDTGQTVSARHAAVEGIVGAVESAAASPEAAANSVVGPNA